MFLHSTKRRKHFYYMIVGSSRTKSLSLSGQIYSYSVHGFRIAMITVIIWSRHISFRSRGSFLENFIIALQLNSVNAIKESFEAKDIIYKQYLLH